MLRILPTRIPVYLIVIFLVTLAMASHAAGPVINSFSPAGAYIGDSIAITGKGFTGTTQVTFDGILSKSFVVVNDSTIEAKVPSGAATGYIKVTTPGGTATSATKLVIYVPEITSFNPTTGSEGMNISVSGKYFTGTTAVKFNGVTASNFQVTSSTVISVKVPSGATTGRITVVAPGGTGTSAADFIVKPNITSFSPSSGIVGTVVSISGTTLTGASSVSFNGTLASSVTVNSATNISARVPAGASTGKILVTTTAGTATSSETFTVLPAITDFAPSFGSEGDTITISGTSLDTVTAVLFNGKTSSYVTNSATSISAIVPVGATTGTITVVAPGGTGTSSSNFRVTPIITSFSPLKGVVGTNVSIFGTNLHGVSSVIFNGTYATFVDVETQIIATVPAGATTGKIVVTTSAGTSTSAENFTIYPAVTSMAPMIGRVGDVVTIIGSTFIEITAVLFDGVESSYIVDSATMITATVPAGAHTGKITVMAGSKEALSDLDFMVLPTITTTKPTSGQAGQAIEIQGVTLIGVNLVKYNGTPAVFTVDNDTHISTIVPEGATTGKIALYFFEGYIVSDFEFTVNPSAEISSFTPTKGKAGQEVVITGKHFNDVTEVQFGGCLSPNFTVISDTTITAIVPQRAVTGEIIVTTRAISDPSTFLYAHSTSPFTVLPSITSFDPASGKVGDTVTITGTGFFGSMAAGFNGVMANQVTVYDVTSLRIIVPSGATTGKIMVEGGGENVYSDTDFVVYEDASLEVIMDIGAGYLGSPNNISLRYDLVGPQLYGGWLQIDSGGRAVLSPLQPGNYSLSLSGSHWLKRVINDIAVDGVSYENTTLINGDADGDNQVNLFDFVVLDLNFNKAHAMADLDGSGAVNLFDYVIIDTNFGAQGDHAP